MLAFEKNLRLLRATKQLSQDKVAKGLGITRAAYAQYEKGCRRPDVDMIYRISVFYEVSVECLFCQTQAELFHRLSNSPIVQARAHRLLDIFNSLSDYSKGRLLAQAEYIWRDEQRQKI